MQPDDDMTKLGAVADFMARLTLARVLLSLMAGGGSVAIYALWEQRAQWTPYLWQSQPLLIALLVGGVLIAVGAAMQAFQRRVDTQNAQLYQQMRDQINDLRREIEEGRAERRELQLSITDLTAAEKVCQERVTRLTHELERVKEQVTRGNGAP